MHISEIVRNPLTKTAGRKIRFRIFGGAGGQIKLELLPDQGLGTTCHQISEVLNPGQAVEQNSWNDEPDPEDHEYEAQNIQQF